MSCPSCSSNNTLIGFDFFFFQAEDGIRDGHVTGVQTCALPISTFVGGGGAGGQGRGEGGRQAGQEAGSGGRSEERRVGKECLGGRTMGPTASEIKKNSRHSRNKYGWNKYSRKQSIIKQVNNTTA